MENESYTGPRINELVPVGELLQTHPRLQRYLPTKGSVEWAVRVHRHDYIAGRALFEIAGRLLVHPARFEHVTLEIGTRTLAARHGVKGSTA
jgi:hypothetical protein